MKDALIAWDFSGVLNVFGDTALPLLGQLQAHGAEQIVVSSSLPGSIEQYLLLNGLDSYISQVYGFAPTALQWVGDSATMKEDVLHHHLRKFGPYSKVIVIGDSESDIRAGKEVHAETILFCNGLLSFETTADQVAHSLDELASLLLNHEDKK